jgi:LacI family transcriptional regulator
MSKATRDRVHSIAKQFNYQPSFMAKSLSSGKTKTLGLIIGDIDIPHYAELAGAALEVAERYGHQLLISATEWDHEKELKCLDSLMQRQVDGIIFCPGALDVDSAIYKNIMKHHFPLILYNMTLKGISSISSDYKNGMHEALCLLKENGHERVAFISSTIGNTNKKNEFKKACSRFGIEAIYIYEKNWKGPSWNLNVFKKLGTGNSKIKAAIVSADHLAQMFIGFLNRQNISVPEDIDIISIDGTCWGTYGYPALTSIKQDRISLMEKAIVLLLNPSEKPECVKVPTKLIIRDSVKVNNNKKENF